MKKNVNVPLKEAFQKSLAKQSARPSIADSQAAKAPASPTLQSVALESIMPSPTNPRKRFDDDKLQELADSIARLGIQQPLIVRPLPKYELREPDMITKTWRIVKLDPAYAPDAAVWEIVNEYPDNKTGERYARAELGVKTQFSFELVAGERRWRAAALAKCATVPVLCSDLTDAEALEIQCIENLQRENLEPLEEAEGFRKLIDAGLYTVATLSEKTGIKRSTIFSRMALLKLAPAVKKALEEERIPATVAELIGRLPGAKLQEEALEEIAPGYDNPMSFRDAKNFLTLHYQVDLNAAKFDRFGIYSSENEEDHELLGTNGACDGCPHRSGNCADQFPDIKSPNVCTLPDCYQAKERAHAANLIHEAQRSGAKFLSDAEAKRVFGYRDQLNHNAGYVKISDVCEDDKKQRTFEKLLGKEAPEPIMAVRDGQLIQLYKSTEIEPALAEQGFKLEPDPEEETGDPEWKKQAEERKARVEAREAIAKRAIEEMRVQERSQNADLKFWRDLAVRLCSNTGYAERWNLYPDDGANERDVLTSHFSSMSEGDCRASIMEALDFDNPVTWDGDFHPSFIGSCERYGIDLARVEESMKPKPAKAEKKGKK